MIEKSPSIIFRKNSSALCRVLSSDALISIVIRVKTLAVFSEISPSVYRTAYLPSNGKRLSPFGSFSISTPSVCMVYVLFSFKAGFATVYKVGLPYASVSPPLPPCKAYRVFSTCVTNTSPPVCNIRSNSLAGMLSGKPAHTNILCVCAKARAMKDVTAVSLSFICAWYSL